MIKILFNICKIIRKSKNIRLSLKEERSFFEAENTINTLLKK